MTKLAKPEPTTEQLAALQTFANSYGKKWKEKLSDKWLNGADANEPDGHLLRQVRNRLGPTWLTKTCTIAPQP